MGQETYNRFFSDAPNSEIISLCLMRYDLIIIDCRNSGQSHLVLVFECNVKMMLMVDVPDLVPNASLPKSQWKSHETFANNYFWSSITP
jgi:hypothetical protein